MIPTAILRKMSEADFLPGDKLLTPEYKMSDAIRDHLIGGIRHTFDEDSPVLKDLFLSKKFVVVLRQNDDGYWGMILTGKQKTDWINFDEYAHHMFQEFYDAGQLVSEIVEI